MIPLTLL